MVKLRRQDPFTLLSPSYWMSMSDQDYWPERTEGLTVYETEDNVIVKANVAGVPADEVDVSYESGTLTIKAEHEETEKEEEEKKVVYKQARKAKYFYTTSVPSAVKPSAITAEVENGVIKVTLPKEERDKAKKIKVSTK